MSYAKRNRENAHCWRCQPNADVCNKSVEIENRTEQAVSEPGLMNVEVFTMGETYASTERNLLQTTRQRTEQPDAEHSLVVMAIKSDTPQ